MKKSKFLVVGLIGLLMAVGLVLASCRTECRSTCKVDGKEGSICTDTKCAEWEKAGGTYNECDC